MSPAQLASLQTTALALFETSRNIFWSALPPAFLFALLMIYVSGEISGSSFEKLFKRVVIAILLLVALPQISELFTSLEMYLVQAFGGDESIKTIFERVSNHAKEIKDAGSSNWLKFGQWGMTVIATLSFLILSLVEHFLDVLHLTIWNLLNILAPIALLGCLFPSQMQIPKGIFMGMFELSLWRPFWVLLGKILIAIGFGDAPTDPSQWFDTAIMNFAVAGLMVSTPVLVHAFLSGSLGALGSSAVQGMVGGAGAILSRIPSQAIQKAAGVGGTAGRAVGAGAWAVGGGKWAANRVKPHIANAKNKVISKAPKYWGLNKNSKK